MKYEYVVRECSRPFGTPIRYGVFQFGKTNIDGSYVEPVRWSEDRDEIENICEQMNTNDDQDV